MDWMLEPPDDEDYNEFDCLDYDLDEACELFYIDEASANASSSWQNSRNL